MRVQMTAQLGPLPPSLRSLLPAQASPIMVAQAAPPIHESAHKGTDSVQTSRWAHGQQVGSMCSVPAQAGPLQMWHERASPLHLELAKVDPSMASLVMSMLDYDPQTRMSAAQGLSHPFLRGLSPALQLPQSKAHSSNEPSEQDVTTDKVDFEYTAGSLTGVSLPFKPEPRRQLAVSLPTRASPAIQASSASWTLPLPSDPVLRGPGPQLGPFPPTEPPQPQPPPMVNAQQHSPLKAAQTKLEPPAQSDSQLAPPQLGLDHVCAAPRPTVGLSPRQPLSPITKPTQQLLEQPSLSGKLSDQCMRSSSSHSAKQGQHAGRGRHAERRQHAEQGQHAEHHIHDPADTPRRVPSAVNGQTTTDPATAGPLVQPSNARILPHAPCAAADMLPVGSDSPAAAVARQPQAPPAATDGSATATLPAAQPRPSASDPKGNAQALLNCPLQAQHQLVPAATHISENPIPGHAQDAEQDPGEESVQGLQQTLGQSAQGAVQTPGVVRAWNGVTRLLQEMTPGSEVRWSPNCITSLLMAAPPAWQHPQHGHTTPMVQSRAL